MTLIIYIIFSIIAIYGVCLNKKILTITAISIGCLVSIVSFYTEQANNHYSGKAWQRMTILISQEIKNGNEIEVSSGIDEFLKTNPPITNYSQAKSFMGYEYMSAIESQIKNKVKEK